MRISDWSSDVCSSDLHEKIGLGGFGRAGNYFERQVGRWTKQYRAAQTDHIPEMEKLIEWLPRTVPRQTRNSIIHGDFRIDNLIFAKDRPKVLAEIGRASCRERVCQYVSMSVVPDSLKKKRK